MAFKYTAEDEKVMETRAKLRKLRSGPYPRLSSNLGLTKNLVVPCGNPSCSAIMTIDASVLPIQTLSEFVFECTRCKQATYEAATIYNLN